MRGTVLLLAAGRGERLGSEPKAFVRLGGTTLIRLSAAAAAAATLVDHIVVAVPKGRVNDARSEMVGLSVPWTVVCGGATRQDSAWEALCACADSAAVAVHDAARPYCPPSLFDACLERLDTFEAAIAAVDPVDTVKECAEGMVVRTLDRSSLVMVQTPQAFRTEVYREAHEAARRDGAHATDDAALVERIGVRVAVVPGTRSNIKITTSEDLSIAISMPHGTRGP